MAQTLEELKAANEAEAAKENNAPDFLVEGKELLDRRAEIGEEAHEKELAEEPELDEEGNEVERKAVEPWMQTDEQTSDVPVKTHVKMKQKLRGRLSESQDEIERLKAENEALKNSTTQQPIQNQPTLKRPLPEDFDTDELHNEAREKYDFDVSNANFNRLMQQNKINDAQKAAKEKINTAVDSHYERAEKLIENSGINPEVYKDTDTIVRQSIDSIVKGKGDIIADFMISSMGEGSEKVLYNLGVNKANMNNFKSLLIDDQSGLKAAIYLGELKQKLTQPAKRQSNAPAPVNNAKGETVSGKGGALKRKYDKVTGKNPQAAYTIKKEARAAGVNTSSW